MHGLQDFLPLLVRVVAAAGNQLPGKSKLTGSDFAPSSQPIPHSRLPDTSHRSHLSRRRETRCVPALPIYAEKPAGGSYLQGHSNKENLTEIVFLQQAFRLMPQ